MKNCGVLLHISSLPSRYGIGNLGREAYAFADFLQGAGQKVWQILPIGPTSYGDSPYQSPSSFAGNPYFIDLDDLCEQGLLTREECDTAVLPCGAVDYGALFASRMPLLRKAFARFDTSCAEYIRFCESQKDWLSTYALFTALKWHFSLRPHWAWPSGYEYPDARRARVCRCTQRGYCLYVLYAIYFRYAVAQVQNVCKRFGHCADRRHAHLCGV